MGQKLAWSMRVGSEMDENYFLEKISMYMYIYSNFLSEGQQATLKPHWSKVSPVLIAVSKLLQ